MIIRVPQIIVYNVLLLMVVCFAVLFTGQSAIKHYHRLAILAQKAESTDRGWQILKKNKVFFHSSFLTLLHDPVGKLKHQIYIFVGHMQLPIEQHS